MNGSPDTNGATRVVLAHADPAVREALHDLTVQGLGMRVVGESDCLEGLRDQAAALLPDLVVVAWQLVSTAGTGSVRDLCCGRGEARIVVLGPRPDTRRVALAAGADAYISMVDAPDVVAATLKTQEPGGLS